MPVSLHYKVTVLLFLVCLENFLLFTTTRLTESNVYALWSVYSLNPIFRRSFPTRWVGDKVLWPKPRHLEDRLDSWPSKSNPLQSLTYYRFNHYSVVRGVLWVLSIVSIMSQSVSWLLFFVDSFFFFAPLSIAHFHRPFLMAVFECLFMLWVSFGVVLVAISISVSIRP